MTASELPARGTLRGLVLAIAALATLALGACSTVKYGALERVGIHKRDVLVSNVKGARKAQKEAQEEFQDALDRYLEVVEAEDSDLKRAYKRLNKEYEDARDAASDVSSEIDDVENVAKALFREWQKEIGEYSDASLRRDSENKLRDTQARADSMIASMREAEASMQPVLRTLRDNVLYLKHNLNAHAVGSLRSKFSELEGDIGNLVEQMRQSIARSDAFIAEMRNADG
ncbi:MAG: DNA repair protein [Gammaproteobacteria bacterium]|nr:MAG: DNA repair protein [Gammaproteobacteria bacterium]